MLYNSFKCIYSDNDDNLARRQTCHYFITAVCYAECMLCTFNISGMHNIGFLDIQFSSDCHFYICSPFALKIHNVIKKHVKKLLREVLWNFAEAVL